MNSQTTVTDTEAVVDRSREHSALRQGNGRIVSFLIVVVVTTVAVFSIGRLNPPAPSDDPNIAEFSVSRAMMHLIALSRQPHPIGSAAHAQVLEYISKQVTQLGLATHVQTSTAVNAKWGIPFRAGTVQNVIGTLKGAANEYPILVVGHYDSVPLSFGGSDNAAAVAAMLESIRALRSGPPLKNDVTFLFTDGEEVGLLGAKAFLDDQEPPRHPSLVLNFEARGNTGPSIMFQTGSNNGWLIDQFGKLAPHPAANSLSNDLYRHMPNDTDFTVFKNAGDSGFNFAYIEGFPYYHSSFDTAANVDQRSLQHHGLNVLALIRYFGNLSYAPRQAQDVVYFDVLNFAVIRYRTAIAVLVGLLTVVLTTVVVVIGFKKRLLTFPGIGKGVIAVFVSLMATMLATIGPMKLISFLQTIVPRAANDRYHDGFYVVAVVMVAISISVAAFAWLLKRNTADNLSAGALIWFLLLSIVSTSYLVGGSYLFALPLLFSLLGIGCGWLLYPHYPTLSEWIAIVATTIPGLILFPPMLFNIYVAFGLRMAPVITAGTALVMALFVPLIAKLSREARVVVSVSGILFAVALIGTALFEAKVDAQHPKLDTLFYALNTDSKRAVWASSDQVTDEWTGQFLPSRAQRQSLGDYLPRSSGRQFLTAEAPLAVLAPPEVHLFEEKEGENGHSVRLRVISRRQASAIAVFVNWEVSDSWVNGKLIQGRDSGIDHVPADRWALIYWDPPQEGIELELRSKSAGPLRVQVWDRTDGLPRFSALSTKPRPEYLAPRPFSDTDSTFVTASYSFGQ